MCRQSIRDDDKASGVEPCWFVCWGAICPVIQALSRYLHGNHLISYVYSEEKVFRICFDLQCPWANHIRRSRWEGPVFR